MYPKDNIFQIYYNIGKRLPFQVKRSPMGLKGSCDTEYRYSQEGQTFMVEEIKIHNKIYGSAKGYCLIDGKRCDEYMEIPCAGCGEWVLVDVPNANIDEIFPLHQANDILMFGKYKGKTFEEVFIIDEQYLHWLTQSDPYFRIDFDGISAKTSKSTDETKQ